MKLHLGIAQPDDYYGEVTGTVVMMVEREREPNSAAEEKPPDDGLKRTKDGILLNPQPQNDPNDPLNWPVWRRDMALLVIGFHSFVIGGQTAVLATGFTSMSEEFGVTQSKLAYLVGAYMLTLGVGSVFFAPTAVLYGKRLVYLVALIVWIVGAIIGGASHSFAMLLVGRVIMGFGGSPTEALPSSSIAEIYFLHERAYRLGIYTLLMLGGKNIVPMIAGFIISSLGWNWLFWIETIIVGMNLVLTFFFVPETFFERPAVPKDKKSIRETELAREARANSLLSHYSKSSKEASRANSSVDVARTSGTAATLSGLDPDTSTSSQETATASDEKQPEEPEKSEGNETGDSTEDPSESSEQAAANSATQTPKPKKKATFDLRGTPGYPSTQEGDDYFGNFSSHTEHPESSERPQMQSMSTSMSVLSANALYLRHNLPAIPDTPKKSFVETLRIYYGPLSKDKWWMIALRPFVLFAYPAVLFSTLIYAFSVVWLIVISEVISAMFTPAPYNFPATSVGLMYISTFLGGCLGSAVAGRMSDVIVRVMSRRNNGTYEPEYRLVVVPVIMVTVAMGMMGFGWATFDHDHWIVPAIFLGIQGFGCSLGSTTAITYVVDCYKMFASEALVCLNLSKNVIGFLFSLFVPHFRETSGAKTTFVVFGCIEIFLCLLGIPTYIYGKRFRHWTDRANMMKRFYVDDS